jgi:hypothetical protein
MAQMKVAMATVKLPPIRFSALGLPIAMPGSIRISSARASNGKYCLVQQLDGFIHLYTLAGKMVRILDRSIRTDTQPMLTYAGDEHVYTVEGDSVYRRSLIDDADVELIKRFNEYANLSEGRHAEGDLQPSGYMALTGLRPDGEAVFTYNVLTGKTGSPYPIRNPFDGVKVCDDGTMLVSGPLGILAIPQVGTSYLVTEANGHACACVDGGRSKLLWCSNARRRGWRNAVELIDVQDPAAGSSQVLMDFEKKNYAVHLTAGPDCGYCSAYDPSDTLPNQIWRLPFSGAAPELLHEWRAPYRKDYEPRATCSGNVILYNVPVASGHCVVQALLLSGAGTPPDEEGTPEDPPGDHYALIDYTAFEGRKFRLEQELVARGGVLVATSTRMYEQV